MADKDLSQLIASLKTEAIEAAEEEARRIVAQARQQAQDVKEAAERKKRQLLAEAEREAADIIQKGKQALQQAARDLNQSLQQEILELLRTVFEAEVRTSFTPDLVRTTIVPVLENVGRDVELELPDKLLQELGDYIRMQLQNTDGTVTLRSGRNHAQQIIIRKTTEGWIYEISPETINEALRPLLTRRWMEMLEEKP